MKLNQNELQAMAVRLYGNLRKQAEIAQDQLNAIQDKANAKKIMEIIKQVREFDKAFKAMPKCTRDAVQNYCGGHYYSKAPFGKFATKLDPEQMVKSMRKKQITVTVPMDPSNNRYQSVLYYDLTVAQIDSDNVDEMLNKVARRYVKVSSGQAAPRVK